MLEPERIIRLEGDAVVLLDQRRLPDEEVELVCRTTPELVEAIRTLAVRGAPAIGIAAAYGYAAAAARGEDLDDATAALAASRPTAVNLAWALAEMARWDGDPAERARQIHAEEVERCRAMSAHAATLLFPGTRALTHCNAGGLATGGYGTAVGALRAAWEQGLLEHVLVDETRPLAPGRAPDRLGARGGRYPVHGDRRLGGRADDGARRGGRDLHRRRPDRRERRHREQDRHLHARRARERTTACRSTSSRRARPSTLRRRTGTAIPIEERSGEEVTARFAGAESGLRRHPGRADHGDRHRGRRAPGAVRGVARGGGRCPP